MMTPTQEIPKNSSNSTDEFLDITSLICPMTFVRTKLKLEKLVAGQLLRVRLKGREPLANVPRSAREHGHEIVSLMPEDPTTGDDGVYILTIRKADT